MSQHNDIPFRRSLPDVPLSTPQQEIVLKQRSKEVEGDIRKLYKAKTELSPSKSFFTQTAFGRTLSGRNKTGEYLRKFGGTAIGIGLAMVGIDASILTNAANTTTSNWLAVLQQIEQILLVIGGIITTIGQMIDKAEVVRERWDEKQIATGKQPLARKINPKRK